jgi:hypothetical protein
MTPTMQAPYLQRLGNNVYFITYGDLTAVKTKIKIFWDVTPYRLVYSYKHFQGTGPLHFEDRTRRGGQKVHRKHWSK